MQVTVGARITVENPPKEMLDYCRKELVLANPDYTKKKRMGFYTGNVPEKIQLYETRGESLVLPYGCLALIVACSVPGRDAIRLDMPTPKTIDYNASVPLYEYQAKAVDRMWSTQYGILQAPAGSGKTQMGIALAIKHQRRTLWLTHTIDLLNQSKARALQFIDPKLIGTITAGKVALGEGITFATVQTMSKLDLSLYKDYWDCIIVDECHRVAGTPTALTQFSTVLNNLSARHKYGLSATVHRADGMIKATFSLLGSVAHVVDESEVADKIMPVTVHPVGTDVDYAASFLDTDGTIVYSKLIEYLTGYAPRNELILQFLCENSEHSNLILSDRVEHLRTLMNSLPTHLRPYAVMVDGKMTSKKAKAEREQAMEDMRSGKMRYLFATYALAKEGLDIPRLDRLYLTTPQTDYAVVTQSIGRIARTFPGKEDPIAFDFVDAKIRYLARAYKKRCTSYRKAGCKFD